MDFDFFFVFTCRFWNLGQRHVSILSKFRGDRCKGHKIETRLFEPIVRTVISKLLVCNTESTLPRPGGSQPKGEIYLQAVLGIRDILVHIRIHRSVPLANGSGSVPLTNGSRTRRPKSCRSCGSCGLCGSGSPTLPARLPDGPQPFHGRFYYTHTWGPWTNHHLSLLLPQTDPALCVLYNPSMPAEHIKFAKRTIFASIRSCYYWLWWLSLFL